MEVTPEEKEFIEAVRNYNRSFPNGYPELLWEIERMLDDMIRQPYF